MVDFNELVEDYSRHEVPKNKTVTGWHIGMIMIGVAITVPAFMVGSTLGQALGFSRAIPAFFIGSFILTIIAGCVGSVGASTHLSTAMIIKRSFGKEGSRVVNFILGITWLGWFAVIAALFGQAVSSGLSDLGLPAIPENVAIVLGAVLMVVVTIFGFKALDKLSLVAVPVMALFLALVVYLSLKNQPAGTILQSKGVDKLDLGAAISLVVGTFIVGTTMFPDLCRYAKSQSHAWIGSVIAFVVGYATVLSMAAIPSIATGEADLMKIISALGLGAIGLFMLIFATWTTNSYNLYSASLAFAPVFAKFEKWVLVVFISIAGTLIALLGAAQYLIEWVTFLSVALPPVAGVYVTDYFVFTSSWLDTQQRSGIWWPAFAAWLVGTAIAQMAAMETIRLTSMPAVDAIITAVVVYYGLMRWVMKVSTSEYTPSEVK